VARSYRQAYESSKNKGGNAVKPAAGKAAAGRAKAKK